MENSMTTIWINICYLLNVQAMNCNCTGFFLSLFKKKQKFEIENGKFEIILSISRAKMSN